MRRLLTSARDTALRHPREAGIVTAGVAAIVLVVSTGLWRQTVPTWPAAPVVQGTLEDTLVESGVVNAQRLMIYTSTIPGAQAKIAEIAPEGKAVAPGDLLVRFDTSAFEQTRERELAAWRQAQAELERAKQEQTLETLRADGDRTAAEQIVSAAENGLANQLEGRGKLEVAEAESVSADTARQLRRARATLDDLRPMLQNGFITRAELDRAEEDWRKADEAKRLADQRLDALLRFERPAASERARADLQNARDGLSRQQEASRSRDAARRAAVALAESRADEVRARLALLDEQIARATVRAQGSGLVVYRDLYFGGDRRKPQVGDEVFPNQPIMALPDSSQFIVDLRVREVDLHRVAANQRVDVQVDAYRDLRVSGEIALIGALAQEDAARAGTKYFPVTVRLSEGDSRLRPGMTARVDIHVRTIENALLVPIEAVFGERGRSSVFVLQGTEWRRRPVTILAESDSHAAIGSGLEKGERVLLVDPTADREP